MQLLLAGLACLAAAVLRGRRYEPGGQSRDARSDPVHLLPNAVMANPYVARATDVTGVLVGDLQPTAPKDVIDPSASEAVVGALARSDVIDPYSGTGPFPSESAPGDGLGFNERRRRVTLGARVHVARMDKLTSTPTGQGSWGYGPEALVPTALGGTYGGFVPGPQYPLASHAPLDSIPQAAREDQVSPEFSRFFAQAHDNEMYRQEEVAAQAEMDRTDTDTSNDIQWPEFKTEMMAQNKTEADAQAMFDIVKDPGEVVGKDKFKELSKTGYAPPHAATLNMQVEVEDAGTWGSIYYCGAEPPPPDASGPPTPEAGVFVTGMRLKRMVSPPGTEVDATSINAVELRCQNAAQGSAPTVGPATIASAEGEQGDWTAWKDCPAGAALDAVHVRVLPYDRNVDNLGITDLAFDCRSVAADASGLHKPEGNLTAPSTDTRDLGGWDQPKRCPADADGNAQFLCAIQTRVLAGRIESTRDNMGLTQLDLQCCPALGR